jgi:hypothetical protein
VSAFAFIAATELPLSQCAREKIVTDANATMLAASHGTPLHALALVADDAALAHAPPTIGMNRRQNPSDLLFAQ